MDKPERIICVHALVSNDKQVDVAVLTSLASGSRPEQPDTIGRRVPRLCLGTDSADQSVPDRRQVNDGICCKMIPVELMQIARTR